MTLDNQTERQIEELQILEQQLQTILMEKQTFQVEVNEGENALGEIKSTKDEVYRILGGIMIKASKEKVIEELEEKKKIIDLKIKSVEKQESLLQKKIDELKSEVQSSLKKKN